MNTWVEGEITRNLHWTDTLFTLEIDASLEPFEAGQFTKLALFSEKQGKRVQRAYSFVNAPFQKPYQFLIVSVENGLLSPLLAKSLPGDKIWLQQQGYGYLTLSEIPKMHHLWMISTGTGISPFLSILADGQVWKAFKRVILVHAVRYASDLVYQEWIRRWLSVRPAQFYYQAIVSREVAPDALGGHVPDLIQAGKLQARVGFDLLPTESSIALCGNPNMIKDTYTQLAKLGFKKHLRRSPGQIVTEKYW